MFSQASVILSTGRGMHGEEGHAWQREVYMVKGDVHGDRGMCGKGGHVWQGCMCVAGGMHGRKGDMCGGGRVWQERCSLQWTVCILLECILVTTRNEVGARLCFYRRV